MPFPRIPTKAYTVKVITLADSDRDFDNIEKARAYKNKMTKGGHIVAFIKKS